MLALVWMIGRSIWRDNEINILLHVVKASSFVLWLFQKRCLAFMSPARIVGKTVSRRLSDSKSVFIGLL